MWVYDKESYERILHLRKQKLKADKDNHPHITFAHYELVDETKIIKHTDKFIKQVNVFNVTFDAVTLFDETIVMTTPFENEIKRYYEIYHKKYQKYLNTYTMIDNFIPHTTLITNEDLFEPFKDTFKPLHLTIDKCQISWVKADGFEIIKTYELKKVG